MTNRWAEGRTALITGATSGFGLALARRVLAAGGRVIAAGRRVERLNALKAEYSADVLSTAALDVTRKGDTEVLLASLPPAFQDIDILFNNAGLALGLTKAHLVDPEDWETMIATNVSGLARVTRAVLPGMVARDRGDVINMASVAATYPYPGANVYGASKAFVRQFSLNLRADLLGSRVRVTSVEPGMCDTEFSLVRFKGDAQAASDVYKGVHALSADDVALTVESILRLPSHINVNAIELMPLQQSFGPLAVHRSG